MMNGLRFSWLDFKVGFRMLARYPGLTLVGTVAIAIAIALGTIYFEAVNKWQNPRLPIRDADRVIWPPWPCWSARSPPQGRPSRDARRYDDRHGHGIDAPARLIHSSRRLFASGRATDRRERIRAILRRWFYSARSAATGSAAARRPGIHDATAPTVTSSTTAMA